MTHRMNRRRVGLAALASGALLTPYFHSHVRAADGKLRIACIGVGNRGQTNSVVMLGEHVVGLCDVDKKYIDSMSERYPQARNFEDWRECLDKTDPDAVVISTPDHTHAPIALAAIKAGMNVYIEKPLAHNVREVKLIEEAAKKKNVVAWMGNQHHASPGYRLAIELLESNVIGPVQRVYAWTNKPTWAQAIKRPTDVPPVPDSLRWDLWLGPAPDRPYHPYYHPVGWRGWWDFGGGAICDMGPHLLDPIFAGLKLAAPERVNARCANDGNRETPPSWSVVRYHFAARADAPPLILEWYDGGRLPKKSVFGRSDAEDYRPPLNGAMVVGELGRMFIPDLGRRPIVTSNDRESPIEIPESKLILTRSHHQEWLEACRTGKPDTEGFARSCRLTDACLLGTIAVRLQRELAWDAEKRNFGGDAEAESMLGRTYRRGWELPVV